MNEQTDLSYMASLYMALADQTRLRLLMKMYDGEVCVGDFTDALGDSQPKISRHLAYLRNAGIVNTRRDGKWIHYSIRWPEEEGGKAMLRAALEWLAGGQVMPQPATVSGDVDAAFNRNQTYSIDIYADTDMSDENGGYDSADSAHNELEEFLL
jgi:ArsR family transcriptional regulator, arsenate/arsenite/antimonite-responsive transcriptional repressor